MPIRIYLILAITIYSVSTFAADENAFIKEIDSLGNVKSFVVAYKEKDYFVVDTFDLPTRGYQQFVKRNKFRNLNQMQAYLKDHATITPLPQIKFYDELKTSDNDVVWPTTNQWDLNWENKYAAWVNENVDLDIFNRYQIETDCADVAIALRWIFARIHGLPAANTLAGTTRLFTNESWLSRFQSLPIHEEWNKDLRFRAALDYVLNNTYTHSLNKDSYPVFITKEFLTPGTHHLDLYSEDSGHTMMVNEINRHKGGVYLVYSNVPRKIRSLYLTRFRDYQQLTKRKQGGFLKIRWPIKTNETWELVPENLMPGYSKEQYDRFTFGTDYFYRLVEKRLEAKMDPVEELRVSIEELKLKLTDRIAIVTDGYAACQVQDCSPGTESYEIWSTPSRDLKISQLLKYIIDDLQDSYEQQAMWDQFLESFYLEIEGEQYNFADNSLYAFYYLDDHTYVSNPKNSVLVRWDLVYYDGDSNR